MPFNFQLPTTSAISLSSCISSTTHPSLPHVATTQRNILRNVLKKHKRLESQARASNLATVHAALDDYISYAFVLDAGLSGRPVNAEEVELSLRKEIEVQWRSTLSSTRSGVEHRRVKGKGLDFEIDFVLSCAAYTHVATSRSSLLTIYGQIVPSVEQRVKVIQNATKNLLAAASIHSYLASRTIETDASQAVIETLSQTHSALSSLALAEATLLAVLKDDPHPFVIAQERNKDDKDWMIKAPEIPKVRAHLFARLCLAAAEHAGTAEAGLSATGRVDRDLIEYVGDLRWTARAKACRFFGIDAELEGETGKAIAWLQGAKEQLGFALDDESRAGTIAGLRKLKKDWKEKREDKKIEKGGEWGGDAGRLEELRIIKHLEAKWTKMNDTVGSVVSIFRCHVSNRPTDKHSIDSTFRLSHSEHALWTRHPFDPCVCETEPR